MVGLYNTAFIYCCPFLALAITDQAKGVTSFTKVNLDCLNWSHRQKLLLEEISNSGADIIALEEVDHFKDFFEPALSRAGFVGHFLPKPSSPCLESKPNNGPDGCALFYRSSAFNLLDKIDLRLLKQEKPGDRKTSSSQVAILAKLECLQSTTSSATDSNPQLCVAVTHFKAKRPFGHIRSIQGQHLLEEMKRFSNNLPFVICGDFNAVPSEPVYEVFHSSTAPKLASAYSVANGGKEPEFTSWKFREAGESIYSIDYIWYTSNQLAVSAVWSLPSREDIGMNGLPTMSYPSDHLAIGAEITINENIA